MTASSWKIFQNDIPKNAYSSARTKGCLHSHSLEQQEEVAGSEKVLTEEFTERLQFSSLSYRESFQIRLQ